MQIVATLRHYHIPIKIAHIKNTKIKCQVWVIKLSYWSPHTLPMETSRCPRFGKHLASSAKEEHVHIL